MGNPAPTPREFSGSTAQVEVEQARKVLQDTSVLIAQILQEVTAFQATTFDPSWCAGIGAQTGVAIMSWREQLLETLVTLVKFYNQLQQVLSHSVSAIQSGDDEQTQALQTLLNAYPLLAAAARAFQE